MTQTPVKSSFGYHIIKLLDKQDAIVTPYDKALQVVRQKYSDEKSKELFADQQQKLSDIGFENPDSLDAVVESLKLTLQKTDFITAQQLPAAINVPAIREQAFAENLRDENTNSEVIAVSDTAAVMLHVIDYKPASAKPLTEVKDQVVAKLKATKAAEKARAEAVALLEKVKAGQAIDEQLTKLNAKVEEKKGMARFGTDIPASLAQVVFRLAKPADKMVSAGLYSDELGNQSVLVLEKVISAPESADSPLQQGLSQQVIKLKQEETYGALIEQLRQKADIKYAAETKESTD